jgi:hypothetical protein
MLDAHFANKCLERILTAISQQMLYSPAAHSPVGIAESVYPGV